MLIVHVVRQFAPSVGGLEDVVRELSTRQAACGSVVRVVTLDRVFLAKADLCGGKLPPRETIDGVEVVRIPFFGSHRYPLAPRVLRYIRDADIVHVHGIDFFFDFLALTKVLHRRWLVASTHGGFFHTRYASGLKAIWFRTVTSLSIRAYAGVVAVSNSDFRRFEPIRGAGLNCIENGVNIERFADAGSPSPAKALICVGRLSTNKRLDRLIVFLKELRRMDPDWSLTIAGRAWDQTADDVRQMIAASGQQDAISVLESPSNPEIRDSMRRASIFVSASEYEGFGLAAVEGLSAGLYPDTLRHRGVSRARQRDGHRQAAAFRRCSVGGACLHQGMGGDSRAVRRTPQGLHGSAPRVRLGYRFGSLSDFLQIGPEPVGSDYS